VRTSAYGNRRDQTYDHLGRVTYDRVWSEATPAASYAEKSYGHDGLGRLGAVVGMVGAFDAEADYTYDGRGRLQAAVGPGEYTAELAYSAAGNLTSAAVSGAVDAPARDVTYEYGAVDPQAVDRLVATGGATFAELGYDVAGNLTSRSYGGATWQLTPDGDDLIREVAGPGGTERYFFGPNAERMVAIGPDGVKLWFAESETHVSPAGQEVKRWHHLGAGEALARVENHTAIELQFEDAVHGLMVTLSPSNVVTSSFVYGGFGELVASTGEGDHRRQFNGKEADAVSGLRHYGVRSYDPVLLRWTAADPKYRFAPDAAWAEPQRANLYAFSLNDPLRYYDPDGRDSEEEDEGDEVETAPADKHPVQRRHPTREERQQARDAERQARDERIRLADEAKARQRFALTRELLRGVLPGWNDAGNVPIVKTFAGMVGPGAWLIPVAGSDLIRDIAKTKSTGDISRDLANVARKVGRGPYDALREIADEVVTISASDVPIVTLDYAGRP
jgi:RHS repeat-associated protein